jgi:hypothetical protein
MGSSAEKLNNLGKWSKLFETTAYTSLLTMSSFGHNRDYNIRYKLIADVIIHRSLNCPLVKGCRILSTESVDNPVFNSVK